MSVAFATTARWMRHNFLTAFSPHYRRIRKRLAAIESGAEATSH